MMERLTRSAVLFLAVLWSMHRGIQSDIVEEDFDFPNPLRILYNIGNMANDIPQANEFISDGANALEIDVEFHTNGIPKRIYHGVPCDCFRNCLRSSELSDYFEHMRLLSNPESQSYNEKLALLIINLRLNDVDGHDDPLLAAGDSIAALIIDKIYNNDTSGSKLWIIVGIPKVSQASAIRGLREGFRRRNQTLILQKIGYEVTDEANMDEIQQMFRGMDIVRGIWQGDGVTNCVAGRSDNRLRQAIALRDSPSGPWVNVDKVYRWTVDTKVAMRHSLRLGVDGIMTNDPDDLLEVLKESEFVSRFRLATNADNPFVKIQGSGPLRFGCSRDTCWKDCTYTGRWCWTSQSGCQSDQSVCSLSVICSGPCGKRRLGRQVPQFLANFLRLVTNKN